MSVQNVAEKDTNTCSPLFSQQRSRIICFSSAGNEELQHNWIRIHSYLSLSTHWLYMKYIFRETERENIEWYINKKKCFYKGFLSLWHLVTELLELWITECLTLIAFVCRRRVCIGNLGIEFIYLHYSDSTFFSETEGGLHTVNTIKKRMWHLISNAIELGLCIYEPRQKSETKMMKHNASWCTLCQKHILYILSNLCQHVKCSVCTTYELSGIVGDPSKIQFEIRLLCCNSSFCHQHQCRQESWGTGLVNGGMKRRK